MILPLIVCTSRLVIAEEKPSSPLASAQWIWRTTDRTAGQRAFLRKTFVVEGDVVEASVNGVADFHTSTVYLNARPVARLENYGRLKKVNVTAFLQPGQNVLAVEGESPSGPAAVALWLTLQRRNGSALEVQTDASWKTSDEPSPKWRQAELKKDALNDWQSAATFGAVDSRIWPQSSAGDIRISPFDDYTQWKQALSDNDSNTPNPASFQTLPGFQIVELRRAQPSESSWVSMAFDPQGRLIVAKEDQGLLRMTFAHDDNRVKQVEVVNNTLKECRGLLFIGNDLYANANKSKGLYRLRDTRGDDRFDEMEQIFASAGGTGHGRNDLAIGPMGKIYSIHGDAVDLPKNVIDRTSPFRESRRGKPMREGHLVRIDRQTKQAELIAAGMRNPFGVAFNEDGEAFTYDADAEFDMGSPWYRPTRVLHLVSGADYTWRGVTGKWPPYYPDRADATPYALNIGKGSPTSVAFGTASRFPPPFRKALFILDWAYGRVLAIHTTPRGAGYTCHAETFLKGRPLNVTDLAFGPDGAMYLITGGRKTQSALYRIRYVGRPVTGSASTPQQDARRRQSAQARHVRRQMEAFHGRSDPRAVDIAWPYLNSDDPLIRHAARIAIEHQEIDQWKHRVWTESKTTSRLTAFLALARSGVKQLRPKLLDQLLKTPFDHFTRAQKLLALRLIALCLPMPTHARHPSRTALIEKLLAMYPHRSFDANDARRFNRELSSLLAHLQAPQAVPTTMELLHNETQQAQRLHYLYVLRTVEHGWTTKSRTAYFHMLGQTSDFIGGQGMPGFLSQIKDDALSTLAIHERPKFAKLLKSPVDAAPLAVSTDRPVVQSWKTGDLLENKTVSGEPPQFDRGKKLFAEALCSGCHRIRGEGAAGGPDLTSAANRFSRQDLLDSILTPAKVVAPPYQLVHVETAKGKILTGQVAPGGDYRSPTLRLIPDPLKPAVVLEIEKRDIASFQLSPTSPMPKGLLDRFTRQEIHDLLAYIESSGDEKHRIFQD